MTELKGLIDQIPLPWQAQIWNRMIKQHENGQLAHAYLAAGPAGLGKLAFVQQFARYLLCQQRTESKPCGSCRECKLNGQAHHPDIHLLQPEEGSRDIKVTQIRGLSEFLIRSSHSGGARIAIIDHAHHMNVSASNALLKSLEEPGDHSYIFLLSDAPGMLSATIRSRCQRLQFSVPAFEEASQWLHEHVDASEDSDRLLTAVDNRPLAALELSRTGSLDAEQEFTEKLIALSAGQLSLAAVTSAALKLGENSAIVCLLKFSTTLTRQLLQDEIVDSKESFSSVLVAYAEKMKSVGGKKHMIANLLIYHQQLVVAYQQVSSGSNPNPQLLLESLLWHFASLPASRGQA